MILSDPNAGKDSMPPVRTVWFVLLFFLVCMPAPARGQMCGPVDFGPILKAHEQVTRELGLKAAFSRMQAAIRDPVWDAEKSQRDAGYRRDFFQEVRKAEQRRKQLALAFLDRFEGALSSGVGLFYRGLALKLSGEPSRAQEALRAFWLRKKKHLLRNRALIEAVECLLLGRSDFRKPKALEKELARIERAGGYLQWLKRKKLSPEQMTMVENLDRKREENDLRAAYFTLVLDLEKEEQKALVDEIKSFTRISKRGDLDEEVYHGSPDGRRAYWSTRPKVRRARQAAVRDFFKEHRTVLARSVGRIWLARAFALAGDTQRAEEAYRRFRDEVVDHPDRAAAGLELARILTHDLDRAEGAAAVVEDLIRAALTPDQDKAVQALKRRLDRERAGREIQHGLLGKPVPALPALDAVGDPVPAEWKLEGRITILVFHAPWSAPSRDLLVKLAGLQKQEPWKSTQILGISRYFGFGWEAADCVDGDLRGRCVGPDLDGKRERALHLRLQQAAGLAFPLALTAEDVLGTRFGVRTYPTVLVVDAGGIVRHLAEGAACLPGVKKVLKAAR